MNHPENANVTKAYELIKKGQRAEAVAIVAEVCWEPEKLVSLLEGFLKFQGKKSTDRRQTNVRNNLAKRRSYRRAG
jgi:hypothetical protein